ncbi:LysR family transcriptional regulator [Alcaligenaceae bacterium]|nr:LysR family transcriptional regulator [Alcaligenaceae bacterium]
MEIRHFRCFLAVAEELHFARAAERLHIEQSPLSRTIKELEEDLGAQLFVRTTRSTRLTRAGHEFLRHVRRILPMMQQARDCTLAVANGYQRQLRVALSDALPPPCLPALLARCREQEPEVEVRMFEMPFSEQFRGLHDDLYDVGFNQVGSVGDGLVARPVWHDPLRVVVPERHPLLTHRHVPLDEVLRYPLVLGHPTICEGFTRQIDRILRRSDDEPLILERVGSFDMMATLVAAGYALGLAGASHMLVCGDRGVVARPLAGKEARLTTYLVHRNEDLSEALERFIERAETLEWSGTDLPESRQPDTSEV